MAYSESRLIEIERRLNQLASREAALETAVAAVRQLQWQTGGGGGSGGGLQYFVAVVTAAAGIGPANTTTRVFGSGAGDVRVVDPSAPGYSTTTGSSQMLLSPIDKTIADGSLVTGVTDGTVYLIQTVFSCSNLS